MLWLAYSNNYKINIKEDQDLGNPYLPNHHFYSFTWDKIHKGARSFLLSELYVKLWH